MEQAGAPAAREVAVPEEPGEREEPEAAADAVEEAEGDAEDTGDDALAVGAADEADVDGPDAGAELDEGEDEHPATKAAEAATAAKPPRAVNGAPAIRRSVISATPFLRAVAARPARSSCTTVIYNYL